MKGRDPRNEKRGFGSEDWDARERTFALGRTVVQKEERMARLSGEAGHVAVHDIDSTRMTIDDFRNVTSAKHLPPSAHPDSGEL